MINRSSRARKKSFPPWFFISPPFKSGLIQIPLIALLACVYHLTSSSLKNATPQLQTPPRLHRNHWILSDEGLEDGETEIGTGGTRDGKTHPSQKNMTELQQQKSFPHFTGDNRQRKERRASAVPTAQTFLTNETLCVSRVDRGPAQTHHVHRSLHGLAASGTSTMWNRTGSSLLLFLTPSCSGSTGDWMLLILCLLFLRVRAGK